MSTVATSSSLAPLMARDLAFGYRDQVVFDGISLTAAPGSRLGMVGENGAGKSTLLRLLAGLEEPRAGTVSGGGDVGFLVQELPFSADTPFSTVIDDALAEIRAAANRLDLLTRRLSENPDDEQVLAEYGQVLEWAQAHDLWDADRRATLVCAGLGLTDIEPDRQLATLSGGQRSRLALAALLIRQPETLLLDEPTNHLDDAGMEFLAQHLTAFTGIVVLSSHDRVFLDEVCTDILDLDPVAHQYTPGQQGIRTLTRYGGSYTDYLAHKKAERARWEQRYAEEQDELEELRFSAAVTARAVAHGRAPRDNEKMGYDYKGGRVHKQVSRRIRNAQLRLAQLEQNQVRKPPAPLRFSGRLTDRTVADELALSLRDVRITQRLHIRQLDIATTSRLLVAGGNGAGKSTLLAVLAEQLVPDSGAMHRARGVSVGLLAQEVAFSNESQTAAQLYATGQASEVSLTQLGLIPPKDIHKPVGELSVGGRRRLALAMLIANPPHVLLLDEPTNHISLTLSEELFEALDSAPGAVVIASHDRWLRRSWSGPELHLANGEVVT